MSADKIISQASVSQTIQSIIEYGTIAVLPKLIDRARRVLVKEAAQRPKETLEQ